MKTKPKKSALLLFAGVVLLVLLATTGTGKKPFSKLTAQDISAASVTLQPPDIDYVIAQDELPHLAELLREVVLYRIEKNPEPIAGQSALLTLTLADGTQTQLSLCGSRAVLDGVVWRAKAKPCNALSAFYNTLRSQQEG